LPLPCRSCGWPGRLPVLLWPPPLLHPPLRLALLLSPALRWLPSAAAGFTGWFLLDRFRLRLLSLFAALEDDATGLRSTGNWILPTTLGPANVSERARITSFCGSPVTADCPSPATRDFTSVISLFMSALGSVFISFLGSSLGDTASACLMVVSTAALGVSSFWMSSWRGSGTGTAFSAFISGSAGVGSG